MKDDRLKIFIPSEPFQIGQTSTGEPIWTDPRDLLMSGDEKLEQRHNMDQKRFFGNVENIANLVLENAQRFISETILNTANADGVKLFMDMEKASLTEWLDKAGYNVIQDGLTTVIKIKDKVIRSMTASVDLCFREAVAARVMEKIVQPVA